MILRLIDGLRVHDATIEQIILGEPCVVRFRRVDGSFVELRMRSCTRYGAASLMSQPIVNTVQKFDVKAYVLPPDEVHALLPDYGRMDDSWREMVGDARFVVGMSFSYGGDLAIACSEIVVVDLEPPRD
jgi:hypothetical protein